MMIKLKTNTNYDTVATVIFLEEGKTRKELSHFQPLIDNVIGAKQFLFKSGEIFPLIIEKKLILLKSFLLIKKKIPLLLLSKVLKLEITNGINISL